MSLSKIEINTDYDEVANHINPDHLSKIHKELKIAKGVIYNFISDEELLEVNRTVLNHDYYTDILTFDYGDDPDIEDHEILISWERITENALALGETITRELHRVCIHGLLHIYGQNDDTPEAKQKMTSLENHFLDLYCST